jgi:hypothetical protein
VRPLAQVPKVAVSEKTKAELDRLQLRLIAERENRGVTLDDAIRYLLALEALAREQVTP